MEEVQAMRENLKKMVTYYKPYKGLFYSDMFFAILGAAVTLAIPLIVRYITGSVVNRPLQEATGLIMKLGILMVVMILVELGCNFYISYFGHIMGAKISMI